MPSPSPITWPVIAGALVIVVVVLLLLLVQTRRALLAERRAAVDDDRFTARLQVSVTDQAGRLRIIRELQDLAVHRVSAIIAQADGARYAAVADPTAAVRAMEGIAEAGRSTLADLRRVMTLVRESGEDAAPLPPLASTLELFATMRTAGLDVVVEEHGDAYDLGAAAELAVHRILQEALANALQHGGVGTQVRVGLTWTAAGLAVSAADDGFRTAVLNQGLSSEETADRLRYGVEEDVRSLTQQLDGPAIQEMRARAELFGGALTASQTPGVGVTISATFPSIRFHNGVHGVDLTRR